MINNNQRRHNKQQIVAKIKRAAKRYKQELAGNTFLIIYEGNAIEVTFKAKNFLHLCGVDTTLGNAKEFYRKASNGTLRDDEVCFSSMHPYDLAAIKSDSLNDMIDLFTNEMLIVTDVATQTHQFALGATDLKILICLDQDINIYGNVIGHSFIPRSLRVENIRNGKFNDVYAVDYVLKKKTDDKYYSEVVYGDVSSINDYLQQNDINNQHIDI